MWVGSCCVGGAAVLGPATAWEVEVVWMYRCLTAVALGIVGEHEVAGMHGQVGYYGRVVLRVGDVARGVQ